MVDCSGYQLFHTHLGVCGVAWHHSAIVQVLLSLETPQEAHGLLSVSGEKIPPPSFVTHAIENIQFFIEEKPISLRSIPISIDHLPPFTQSVLRACSLLPPGEICTYGDLAKTLRRPKSARAVGQALGRNPVPLIIPCHRVIASGGKLGGFTAPTGTSLKRQLLSMEGILL
jgi:methylated-DNA-[protein]-cysteine S-methyltransferase